MSDYLLYVSIGPVQDFIASARRCQDLWYGSYLLSQLAEACADEMQRLVTSEDGEEARALIFPADISHISQAEASVANKILITVSVQQGANTLQRMRSLAQAGQEAVQRRLRQEADSAFRAINAQSARFFNEEMARAQLDELVEFSWVALPVSSYQESRVDADAVLAARKGSRPWTQVSWNAGLEVPKSSLDGARESVIREEAYDRLSESTLRRQFGVKAGERLCGVGLLKRLGAITHASEQDGHARRARPTFHSTSHMSSAPLLTALACPERGAARRGALQTYLERLEELGLDLTDYRIRVGSHSRASQVCSLEGETRNADRVFAQEAGGGERPRGFDGYLLYESRLPDIVDGCWRDATDDLSVQRSPKYQERRSGLISSAAGALKQCLESFDLKPDQVSKYYGFILADGDYMGALIDALDTPELHRELSRCLVSFAESCRRIVEERGGSLIYAGGDDVLALAPLHTALDICCALRASFSASLSQFLARDDVSALLKTSPHQPSLSVGLSIAHHLDSMSYALNLARRAEQNAKRAGRNALSVLVSRRSGGEYMATGPWDGDRELPGRLRALMRLIGAQQLPHGVSHDLLSAVQSFAPRGELSSADLATWHAASRSALRREVSRVIRRRRVSQGHEYARQAQDLLMQHLEQIPPPDEKEKHPPRPLAEVVTQLSDEVLIARLLWSSYQNAWSAQ